MLEQIGIHTCMWTQITDKNTKPHGPQRTNILTINIINHKEPHTVMHFTHWSVSPLVLFYGAIVLQNCRTTELLYGAVVQYNY